MNGLSIGKDKGSQHRLGRRFDKRKVLVCNRMDKPKPPGMQHLPGDTPFHVLRIGREIFLARPIDRIAHQGMTYLGHMDPDLMGATGINTNPNQTIPMIRTRPDKLIE